MSTVRTARNDAPPGGEPSGAPSVTHPVAGPEQTSAVPPSRDSADRSPWANSQFWILQLIILALYLIRLAATVAFHLNVDSQPVEFSTLALFLVPVVYATLNYAIEGALFTASWVTLLAVARFFSARANHDNVAAWTELAQIILIDAVAIVIGQRVTAERNARRAAESAQALHLSAEARYRDLFYSNQAPILIVDANGNVIETNASASGHSGCRRHSLTPLPVNRTLCPFLTCPFPSDWST